MGRYELVMGWVGRNGMSGSVVQFHQNYHKANVSSGNIGNIKYKLKTSKTQNNNRIYIKSNNRHTKDSVSDVCEINVNTHFLMAYPILRHQCPQLGREDTHDGIYFLVCTISVYSWTTTLQVRGLYSKRRVCDSWWNIPYDGVQLGFIHE